MKKKTVMAAPLAGFWAVIAACVIGIIIGSLRDLQINEALANKTEVGAFFATYGSYFSYCLYPAAGACLFVRLKKKGDRYRLRVRAAVRFQPHPYDESFSVGRMLRNADHLSDLFRDQYRFSARGGTAKTMRRCSL